MTNLEIGLILGYIVIYVTGGLLFFIPELRADYRNGQVKRRGVVLCITTNGWIALLWPIMLSIGLFRK